MFKKEFDSVKELSSLTFHLRSHAPLITRASSASPRCSSPAGAFGAAHHARFLYGLVAHNSHHLRSVKFYKRGTDNGQRTDTLKVFGLVPYLRLGIQDFDPFNLTVPLAIAQNGRSP